jgi:hypothetical protein
MRSITGSRINLLYRRRAFLAGSPMARNARKQARRETLEHELQEVRNTIQALREAPEPQGRRMNSSGQ